jgi:hypothetical protein
MLHTEFVRILNCNYERILLSEIPDTNRYQFHIIGRGGIKGLLPCSLRLIDNKAYLYYDITSTQNVAELYSSKKIDREWIKNFLWSMRQVQTELNRFLLDNRNILWFPQHIFQDLGSKEFRFLYIPYYGIDCGLLQLLEFWIEHIDYSDSALVDFIYKIYNQYDLLGSVYLEELIFEDGKCLEKRGTSNAEEISAETNIPETEANEIISNEATAKGIESNESKITEFVSQGKALENNKLLYHKKMNTSKQEEQRQKRTKDRTEKDNMVKKGLLQLLSEGYKKHQKDKEPYGKENLELQINEYAVCEILAEEKEEEECGRTIYVEEDQHHPQKHVLYNRENGEVIQIRNDAFLIGKQCEEVDLCLLENTASRIHARITKDHDDLYLEDLNSTNGTFKNGLRLNPYEKRKLESGDEIKFGRTAYIFR